jgi:hypothetical protein
MQELKIGKWCIGFLVLMDTAFCTNGKKYLIWYAWLISALMVLYYRCSFIGGIYCLLTELLKSTDVTFPRVFFICHLLANILNKNCKLSWESYFMYVPFPVYWIILENMYSYFFVLCGYELISYEQKKCGLRAFLGRCFFTFHNFEFKSWSKKALP